MHEVVCSLKERLQHQDGSDFNQCSSGASYSQQEGHGCHVTTRQSSAGSAVRPRGNVQWIFVLTASCYRNRLVFVVKRLMLQKDLVLGS